MKVKVESEKVGLKLNIQKKMIMASSPITSWEIDGETMETVTNFIFLSSKITTDSDGSHEIKRCLLLRRKGMTNLTCILVQVFFDFLLLYSSPLWWKRHFFFFLVLVLDGLFFFSFFSVDCWLSVSSHLYSHCPAAPAQTTALARLKVTDSRPAFSSRTRHTL